MSWWTFNHEKYLIGEEAINLVSETFKKIKGSNEDLHLPFCDFVLSLEKALLIQTDLLNIDSEGVRSFKIQEISSRKNILIEYTTGIKEPLVNWFVKMLDSIKVVYIKRWNRPPKLNEVLEIVNFVLAPALPSWITDKNQINFDQLKVEEI